MKTKRPLAEEQAEVAHLCEQKAKLLALEVTAKNAWAHAMACKVLRKNLWDARNAIHDRACRKQLEAAKAELEGKMGVFPNLSRKQP